MAAWGYEFYHSKIKFVNFFLPILLLFYRSFHVFLTIAIYIYLCFAGEILFWFLAFGFISHMTRISNKTSFLYKKGYYWKNKFRNNLSRFTKLKCFVTNITVNIFREWSVASIWHLPADKFFFSSKLLAEEYINTLGRNCTLNNSLVS